MYICCNTQADNNSDHFALENTTKKYVRGPWVVDTRVPIRSFVSSPEENTLKNATTVRWRCAECMTRVVRGAGATGRRSRSSTPPPPQRYNIEQVLLLLCIMFSSLTLTHQKKTKLRWRIDCCSVSGDVTRPRATQISKYLLILVEYIIIYYVLYVYKRRRIRIYVECGCIVNKTISCIQNNGTDKNNKFVQESQGTRIGCRLNLIYYIIITILRNVK